MQAEQHQVTFRLGAGVVAAPDGLTVGRSGAGDGSGAGAEIERGDGADMHQPGRARGEAGARDDLRPADHRGADRSVVGATAAMGEVDHRPRPRHGLRYGASVGDITAQQPDART